MIKGICFQILIVNKCSLTFQCINANMPNTTNLLTTQKFGFVYVRLHKNVQCKKKKEKKSLKRQTC